MKAPAPDMKHGFLFRGDLLERLNPKHPQTKKHDRSRSHGDEGDLFSMLRIAFIAPMCYAFYQLYADMRLQ